MYIRVRYYTLMDRSLVEVERVEQEGPPPWTPKLIQRVYSMRVCDHVTCALQAIMEALDVAQGVSSEHEPLGTCLPDPQVRDQ